MKKIGSVDKGNPSKLPYIWWSQNGSNSNDPHTLLLACLRTIIFQGRAAKLRGCILSSWWFHPIWKIWSSTWIISPNKGWTLNLSCHHPDTYNSLVVSSLSSIFWAFKKPSKRRPSLYIADFHRLPGLGNSTERGFQLKTGLWQVPKKGVKKPWQQKTCHGPTLAKITRTPPEKTKESPP